MAEPLTNGRSLNRMSCPFSTISGMDDFTTADGSEPERVVLQPDASVLDALGRGHTLTSALADLIDNSIDAGAGSVSIMFVVKDSMIRSIRIADDGCGMTAHQLADAMTIGRRRQYGSSSLGHFGVGLKGASLSQARVLSVYSTSGHAQPAGMRLAKGQSGNGIIADVIDADAVAAILRLRGVGASGTLVEWTHLESVSVATTLQERRRWIERTILQVRDELGLTFHRLLADGRVRIELVEMDEDSGETGAPRRVRPIDPFGFDRWGINGYPRRLSVQLQGGVVIHADLFVLAPGVESGLIGRSRREAQGLYIYRNGRLLQSGGWGGFRSDLPPDLQLARIAIDLAEDALDAFVINPEKRGVILRPSIVQGLERAVTDGVTLRAFWDACRDAWTQSKRREIRARPFAQLGEGVPSALSGIVEQTVGVREGDDAAVSFDWKLLDHEQLFVFDPPTGIIWLNERHRTRLEQDEGNLSLIKTSLFFLLEPHAGKERLAATTAERLDAMQAGMAANVIPQREAQEVARVDLPIIGGDPKLPRAVVERADPDEPLADPRVAHVHVSGEGLDDFMRGVRKSALLEAEEEVALGAAIEAGLFARERLLQQHGGRVFDQETLDLAFVERAGKRAQDRMVLSNVRLVISIARKYQYNGLELGDLIQEGILGLIHAVKKFDYAQGTKFSTYGTWWIRQAITRALADRGRMIRFPVHVVEKLPEIKQQWNESEGSATERLHAVAEQRAESVGAIRGIVNNLYEPLSLDSTIAVKVDSGSWMPIPVVDVLTESDAFGPEEWAERFDKVRRVNDLLSALSDREQAVMRKRFGMEDGVPQTLDQIGDAFGVTRERIRQIEKKAIESMRRSAGILPQESEARGARQSRDKGAAPGRAAAPRAVKGEAGEEAPVRFDPAAEAAPAAEHTAVPWPTMVRVFGLYSDGWSIARIADAVDTAADDIAAALARCVFDLDEGDVRPLASEHARTALGVPERDRIHQLLTQGLTLSAAGDLTDSPLLLMAWSILDSDERPRLTRRMLSAMRPQEDAAHLARASELS
ncbi:sigma-70 family RNA polymerase sigma factor [Microbacterium foliorum]|nr:sigma-70 family RNA polymerase sigma factor [Microbacterium foliorum]